MLSASFNIDEFMNKVKDQSFEEIIQSADQEATAAERIVYKRCCSDGCGPVAGYARNLKDLILYLRYGVRTRRMRRLNLAEFRQARWDH